MTLTATGLNRAWYSDNVEAAPSLFSPEYAEWAARADTHQRLVQMDFEDTTAVVDRLTKKYVVGSIGAGKFGYTEFTPMNYNVLTNRVDFASDAAYQARVYSRFEELIEELENGGYDVIWSGEEIA